MILHSALAQAIADLTAAILDCRRCQEAGYLPQAMPRLLGLGHAQAPRDPATRPRLLLIGQAPPRQMSTATEWPATPFIRTLTRWLVQAGFPDDAIPGRVHLSALTRCFPGPAQTGQGDRPPKGDRPPSRAEIILCASHLSREIQLVQPRMIVPVGKLAIDYLYGQPRPLSHTIGIPWERDGIVYLPLPHPSGVSRWHNDPTNRQRLSMALDRLSAYRRELQLSP